MSHNADTVIYLDNSIPIEKLNYRISTKMSLIVCVSLNMTIENVKKFLIFNKFVLFSRIN